MTKRAGLLSLLASTALAATAAAIFLEPNAAFTGQDTQATPASSSNGNDWLNAMSNAIGGAAVAESAVTFDPVTAYDLAFDENFDNPVSANAAGDLGPYNSKWVTRDIIKQGIKANRSEQVSISGGALKIAMDYDYGAPTYKAWGGGLISKKLMKYGYYEARIKFWTTKNNHHQAFWTSQDFRRGRREPNYTNDPTQNDTLPLNPGYQDTQATEYNRRLYSNSNYNGHSRSFFGMNYYDGSTSKGPNPHYAQQNTVVDDGDGWTTMGFEFLPDRISWYFNGVFRYTYIIPEEHRDRMTATAVWLTSIPYIDNYQYGRNLESGLSNGVMEVSHFRYYTPKNSIGYNWASNGGFYDKWHGHDIATPEVIPAAVLHDPLGWINVHSTNINGAPDSAYDNDAMTLVRDTYQNGRFNQASLLHYKAEDYRVSTRQILSYIPNGIYQFSAWVRCSNRAGNNHEMKVKVDGGASYSLYVCNNSGTMDAAWRKVTIDDVPVTANGAVLQFYSRATGGSRLYIDNVSFIRTS